MKKNYNILSARVEKLEKKDGSSSFVNNTIAILCLVVIIYLLFIGIKSFFPEDKQTIKFEVVGITNSTNATTLVNLHFECIKYCIVHLSGSSTMEKCWQECANLGKEGVTTND